MGPTGVGSGLTWKIILGWKRLTGAKRSSLFGLFVRDEEKHFTTLATKQRWKRGILTEKEGSIQ